MLHVTNLFMVTFEPSSSPPVHQRIIKLSAHLCSSHAPSVGNSSCKTPPSCCLQQVQLCPRTHTHTRPPPQPPAKTDAGCVQGLKSLQPRVQAWLGRCADTADALAVQALEQQAASGGAARWDPDNILGLTVAFPEDQSLVVWLDKALPLVTPSTRRP